MRATVLLASLLALAASTARAQPAYDLLIQHGRIVDGSGNPWYEADLAIRDGRVVAIGWLDGSSARRVIDAKGLIVAPGFIDVHTHSDRDIARIPTADSYLFDGVTTIVAGNCGGSPIDLGKFFDPLRTQGIAVNFATLIGHNDIREAVMGTEQRDPTPEELARMETLVEEGMRQGAVGLSTGLYYVPGIYSKTQEVVALARAAARHHGLYASHLRNESDSVVEALAEAIQVGREAGMPVEISHFKVMGKPNWGTSVRIIELVERARTEGLDVTVDQYPYTASSTSLSARLSPWALEGGPVETARRLADPATRQRIAAEYKANLVRAKRDHLDYVVIASCKWDPSLEGKTVTEITKERGRKPVLDQEIETALDIVQQGGASIVNHDMDEQDVERIMRYPYAMVASDSDILELGNGVPHPRGYGTNARVLGRYVREKHVLRLEEAIRKMTSLPAQRFRFTERGLLRPGMWADVVVFDERTVADLATFERPHAYSEGFRFVIVNGQIVVEAGQHSGARPGQVLLGPGAPRAQ